MKKTRLIAALLASVTLLSSLAACANEKEEETTEGNVTVDENATDEIRDELPGDLNYGGDEIVFITTDQLDSEKLTGDPVSDVIFERNKAVEQRLKVKITTIQDSYAVDKLVTSVKSNSADYDLLVDRCWVTAPKFTEGYFADLRQTQFLDFEKILMLILLNQLYP